MQSIRDPRWLYAVTILPLTALLGLGYYRFDILDPLLDPSGRLLWMSNALVLVALIAVAFTLTVLLDALRVRLGWISLTGLFAVVTAYLLWTVDALGGMQPADVPGWLRGEALVLPLLACTIPSLLWSVLGCVHLSTLNYSGTRPEKNFLYALAIPFVVYITGQLIVPLLNFQSGLPVAALLIVSLILSTALFLFLLIRGCYLTVRRKAGERARTWFIPILTLLLPLLGLAVNQRLGNDSGWLHHDGFFGDFNRPMVYAMVVMNGLYCSLPRTRDWVVYRLLLFTAGSIGLSFLLYFVLVFLPFLPLSLVAVLLMGIGILLLVPMLILPVQIRLLWEDYRVLERVINGRILMVGATAAFLLIPAGITVDYLGDRATLDRALAYVYHPNDVNGSVDHISLRRVLEHVRRHKSSPASLVSGPRGTQPCLSDYYNWLVLDNLTLSEDKLRKLEAVFLGVERESNRAVAPPEPSDPVRISYARGASSWDTEAGAWRSWVHLELVADSSLRQGEYLTTFELPEGAYIDDYYLYVGDRRESGILAERRTATWVYNQITGSRRDPGLLRYVSANRLRLNVFPFAGGEIRRTGFSVLHREPLTLQLDDRVLPLGRRGDRNVEEAIEIDGLTYLSPNVKRSLVAVELQPRIHYVVDASRRNPEQESTWVKRLKASVDSLSQADAVPPAVTLAGTYAAGFETDEDWESGLAATPPGGFFAERAVEQILNEWITTPDTTYPVFVIVGDDPIIDQDFSAFAHALPGGLHLYRMAADGKLYTLSDADEAINLPATVRAYRYVEPGRREIYLAADDAPSLVVNTGPRSAEVIWRTSEAWRRAMVLRGRYLANRLLGRTGQTEWLEEVRGSFATGVLMPTTALIVVENEAQQRALQRRQKEILDADPHFDLEETLEMSEPTGWLYLILLPFLLYLAPALRRR